MKLTKATRLEMAKRIKDGEWDDSVIVTSTKGQIYCKKAYFVVPMNSDRGHLVITGMNKAQYKVELEDVVKVVH